MESGRREEEGKGGRRAIDTTLFKQSVGSEIVDKRTQKKKKNCVFFSFFVFFFVFFAFLLFYYCCFQPKCLRIFCADFFFSPPSFFRPL